MIEETFSYGLVIGCSLFGILWGLVNALLVSLHSTPLLISRDVCFALCGFV